MARKRAGQPVAEGHINPFLPAPAMQEAPLDILEADPLLQSHSGDLAVHGPATPEAAPRVDVSGETRWPIVEVTARPLVCVMSLHGGAGASVVTSLIGPDALDVGTAWPVFAGWDRPAPELKVLVVCRPHYGGVNAAQRFARLWSAGTLRPSNLLGLVLVDDGPKLTTEQSRVASRVLRMTPNGWHIPWQETWRLTQPSYEASPRRVRSIIKQIRKYAGE